MSGAGHTAGPWHLQHGIVSNRNVRWVETNDYQTIAKLPDTLTHPDSLFHEARVEAAARLIAAAPSLLEALEKCRDKFRHYEDLHRLKSTADGDEKADRNREMADLCDAAIAIARGTAS